MTLWSPELNGRSIHLAVEGSCGGTTIGLQLARHHRGPPRATESGYTAGFAAVPIAAYSGRI